MSARPTASKRGAALAQRSLRRSARWLPPIATVSLVALALGPAASALAAPPALTITSPANGSVTNNQMPSFMGTAFDEEMEPTGPVTLKLYEGATVGAGPPVQSMTTDTVLGGAWLINATEPLNPGTYTAQAEQLDETLKGAERVTAQVTFTVDTATPPVTVTYPANGSSANGGAQLVEGTAGVSGGDLPTITVALFSGSTTEPQARLQALTVQAPEGHWSATFGGLSPGTYTARAEQSDSVGSVGRSAPVTFTMTEPPSPRALSPIASFRWFPSAPRTGESVSLVSSSTDTDSPISGFAWGFGAAGALQVGGPVLRTSFSTAGAHVVRLRVTAADGLSSVARETVRVTSPPLVLMQPFPIVRIVGSRTSSGVHLDLLTVQAPVGVRVTVTCRGRGCPAKSEHHLLAASSKRPSAATVAVAFRSFERSLRAGLTLRVLVTKPGEIGKYTRFTIRRDRLPARVDSCLLPSEPNPIACPS